MAIRESAMKRKNIKGEERKKKRLWADCGCKRHISRGSTVYSGSRSDCSKSAGLNASDVTLPYKTEKETLLWALDQPNICYNQAHCEHEGDDVGGGES